MHSNLFLSVTFSLLLFLPLSAHAISIEQHTEPFFSMTEPFADALPVQISAGMEGKGLLVLLRRKYANMTDRELYEEGLLIKPRDKKISRYWLISITFKGLILNHLLLLENAVNITLHTILEIPHFGQVIIAGSQEQNQISCGYLIILSIASANTTYNGTFCPYIENINYTNITIESMLYIHDEIGDGLLIAGRAQIVEYDYVELELPYIARINLSKQSGMLWLL